MDEQLISNSCGIINDAEKHHPTEIQMQESNAVQAVAALYMEWKETTANIGLCFP